jgi:hypothetical protein
LFDADLIAEAKNCDYTTFAKIPKNSAFHRLSIAYQSLVADTLYRLCEQEIGHLHFYKEEHQDAKYQAIEACDIETKIQIIAKSFVRNDEFRPYVLCTAYRPFPKISGKQVRKKVLERWKQETQSVSTGIVLVIHNKSGT